MNTDLFPYIVIIPSLPSEKEYLNFGILWTSGCTVVECFHEVIFEDGDRVDVIVVRFKILRMCSLNRPLTSGPRRFNNRLYVWLELAVPKGWKKGDQNCCNIDRGAVAE